jgi:hypothetical protein
MIQRDGVETAVTVHGTVGSPRTLRLVRRKSQGFGLLIAYNNIDWLRNADIIIYRMISKRLYQRANKHAPLSASWFPVTTGDLRLSSSESISSVSSPSSGILLRSKSSFKSCRRIKVRQALLFGAQAPRWLRVSAATSLRSSASCSVGICGDKLCCRGGEREPPGVVVFSTFGRGSITCEEESTWG